ncbi:MAG TPA: aminotransferase class V-fold PLP-dependent enzyme, partial [Candidatus Hodarchaeales archaeon]|nr:aminotransferase class V-fold PLP-dependent enzyme [Candidatus Hodarchaeales archaeon]
GSINPVQDIAKWAHDAGAVILVDGAQSAPHMPIDVKRLDLDFYAVSGHKMCAPTGIGFLYGRAELLEAMEPVLFGGDMIREVKARSATWNDIPWKFEAGTPNIADTIGLGVAVDYLGKTIGMKAVENHEKELTTYALKRIEEEGSIEVIGPATPDMRGAVISFKFDPFHPHDIAQILDQQGVAIRSGHHCAQPLIERLGLPATSRASFYLYNTHEEVELFLASLKHVQTIFS